jgi:predicted ATPase
MIGRDDTIGAVRALIISRFVSIVGAGGMGETTLAVAVAHKSLEPVF